MTFSVCTWNVNSVRLRLPLLERLARRRAPDVICLQETKCADEKFPREAVAAMGYPHQAICGMKRCNGVAVLSRRPLSLIQTRSFCGKEDCRHIAAAVDGVVVHSIYVPAGGDEPDPAVNPKFAHKLAFLEEMEAWLRTSVRRGDQVVLAGDFNIAPLPCDVWDHRKLLKTVSHTPVEVEALRRVQATQDWTDAARRFFPPPQPLFTWWSYRRTDWAATERGGRRLDHIWASPALASRLLSFEAAVAARKWETPSDHVPVLATFSEGQSLDAGDGFGGGKQVVGDGVGLDAP